MNSLKIRSKLLVPLQFFDIVGFNPNNPNPLNEYPLDYLHSGARLISFQVNDLEQYEIFSKKDIDDLRRGPAIRWCIETEEFQGNGYEIHLLLLAFKLTKPCSVMVSSYLYPDQLMNSSKPDISYHTKDLDQTEDFPIFEAIELADVEKYYCALKEMHALGGRASNAIGFTMHGLFQNHAIGAILHWSAALECIFGCKRGTEDATKKIVNRITGYLSSDDFNNKKISELYNLRSRLIHGEVDKIWQADEKENLKITKECWILWRSCFQKLLLERHFEILNKKNDEREEFFDGFYSNELRCLTQPSP